ncbi:MAG: hypothetical protein ACOVOR_01660 [Rhabdochlamydiaceae bacterium]
MMTLKNLSPLEFFTDSYKLIHDDVFTLNHGVKNFRAEVMCIATFASFVFLSFYSKYSLITPSPLNSPYLYRATLSISCAAQNLALLSIFISLTHLGIQLNPHPKYLTNKDHSTEAKWHFSRSFIYLMISYSAFSISKHSPHFSSIKFCSLSPTNMCLFKALNYYKNCTITQLALTIFVFLGLRLYKVMDFFSYAFYQISKIIYKESVLVKKYVKIKDESHLNDFLASACMKHHLRAMEAAIDHKLFPTNRKTFGHFCYWVLSDSEMAHLTNYMIKKHDKHPEFQNIFDLGCQSFIGSSMNDSWVDRKQTTHIFVTHPNFHRGLNKYIRLNSI